MENVKKYGYKRLKEVLADVKICTQLYCTKDGEVHSSEAEMFLDWLNEFTRYCIPEKVEEWENITRKIVYSPLVLEPDINPVPDIQKLIDNKDFEIIDTLFNFIDAGEVMQTYDITHSWEEVDKIIEHQGHSGWTMSGLSNIMVRYSPYGVDFVERYDPNRLKRDKSFLEEYVNAIIYNEKRKELNKKLIYVLSKKKRSNCIEEC